MISKVDRYADIDKMMDADFFMNHQEEYVKLCDEANILKEQMSLEELESLHGKIKSSQWHRVIMPLIIQRKRK